MKKFLYNNLELIVVLFITFMLFVTLVLFYENKIDELEAVNKKECEVPITEEYTYQINEEGLFVIDIKYIDQINANYIKVEDSYNEDLIVKLDSEIVSGFIPSTSYTLYFKNDLCNVYNVSDLDQLINDSELVKVVQK